jgi:LPS export ABC transporter protein LptC/lipopolysaccharide transport protein LptA
MAPSRSRLRVGPLRAVTTLRALILIGMAGMILWTALSWGRRGPQQADITMSAAAAATGEGPVVDQSDTFAANGTREGRPAFEIAAQTVTGFEGDRKQLHTVDLTVHEQEGGTVQVQSREGQFDPTSRRAQLTGDVVIHTPDGMKLTTGNLYYDSDRDMIYTGDPIRFLLGPAEGTGEGMNYLVNERRVKIASRVDMILKPQDGTDPVHIRSGSLVASLEDNSAVFSDAVTLDRAGDRLTGRYLRIELDEKRKQVHAMRSYGDVTVTLAPSAEGQQGGSMHADSLTIGLGPGNTLLTAEASGGCHFNSPPYTGSSRTAFFTKADDRLELRGDPEVLTTTDRITAQEIDLHPGHQTLEARGEVRTVSLRQDNGTVPGFGSGSAVAFQSQRLVAEQQSGRATYSGGARAWQEGTSLQADEIVVEQESKQVHASGSVMSRFTEKPQPKDPPGTRPQVSVITAHRMTADDQTGKAHYEGDTRLTRPDATMTAETMDLETKDGGKGRALDRIVAQGSVSARHLGAFATAKTAEYNPGRHELVLHDEAGLAEVVDTATGRSMKGRTLTYDMEADRVLTENSAGGRTWIKMTPDGVKPDGGSMRPGEPQPHH